MSWFPATRGITTPCRRPWSSPLTVARRSCIRNKTGYIHYLDAATGEFLRAPAFADRINWIQGYDVEGRPVGQLELPIEDGDAVEVWPSLFGGVNMYPNAYNPLTGNLYLAATNAGMEYKFEDIKVIANVRHFGASVEFIWGYEVELAIDVKTGTEVWRDQKGKWGYAGGMLTTAGNLVFYTRPGGYLPCHECHHRRDSLYLQPRCDAEGRSHHLHAGRQTVCGATGSAVCRAGISKSITWITEA